MPRTNTTFYRKVKNIKMCKCWISMSGFSKSELLSTEVLGEELNNPRSFTSLHPSSLRHNLTTSMFDLDLLVSTVTTPGPFLGCGPNSTRKPFFFAFCFKACKGYSCLIHRRKHTPQRLTFPCFVEVSEILTENLLTLLPVR